MRKVNSTLRGRQCLAVRHFLFLPFSRLPRGPRRVGLPRDPGGGRGYSFTLVQSPAKLSFLPLPSPIPALFQLPSPQYFHPARGREGQNGFERITFLFMHLNRTPDRRHPVFPFMDERLLVVTREAKKPPRVCYLGRWCCGHILLMANTTLLF